MLLVVCQLSLDVIGYEDSVISNCMVRFDPSIVTVKLHGAELAQVFIKWIKCFDTSNLKLEGT